MGYRGSNSAIGKSIVVKEQRVYGSYFGSVNPRLRCILTGLERDYLIKPFNRLCSTAHAKVGLAQISNPINRSLALYSSLAANKLGKLDPFFITGFTDAEGSFLLSIRSSDKYTSK